MTKKFYRLGYTNPPSDGQKLRLHHSRDGAAFGELSANLPFKGYCYETVIHNYPNHSLARDHFNFLQQTDLLVCATRPPLDDFLGDPKYKNYGKDWRYICPSNDDLEKAIFKDLKRYFSHISRGCVKLQDETAGHLLKGFEAMAQINFHKRGMGTINNFVVEMGGVTREVKPPKEYNSVGYFLHLPKISDYPCSLILSFSMGGYENLLWNRIVRLRFDKWLESPVFGVALLNLPEEPLQPLTPKLADNAKVQVVIEHWLGNGDLSEAAVPKKQSQRKPSK